MINCPKYYEVQEELRNSFTKTMQKYEDTYWGKCLRCPGDCSDKKGLEIRLWRDDEAEVKL